MKRSSALAVLSSLLVVLAGCGSSSSVSVDASPDEGRVDAASDGTTPDAAASDAPQPADGRPDTAADGPTADVGAGVTCDPAKVTCKSLPSPCGRAEAREVIGSCWGECVPIGSCTDLPEFPDCDLTKIRCKMMEPPCPQRYVPSVEGTCYGPCVPDVACSCKPSGPESQCPPELVCHNAFERCGPLD